MTTVQRVARLFGWGFIIVAIAGFVAARGSVAADLELAPAAFGLFPVNLYLSFVHLAFGIWGVGAARSWTPAKAYCQVAGVIYLVLAVLGIFFPEGLGLIPLGGNDIWLHALIGVTLTYFGFTSRAPVAERPAA